MAPALLVASPTMRGRAEAGALISSRATRSAFAGPAGQEGERRLAGGHRASRAGRATTRSAVRPAQPWRPVRVSTTCRPVSTRAITTGVFAVAPSLYGKEVGARPAIATAMSSSRAVCLGAGIATPAVPTRRRLSRTSWVVAAPTAAAGRRLPRLGGVATVSAAGVPGLRLMLS